MNISDPAFQKLLNVCKKVYIKTKELIPYSANKPSLDAISPHRDLVLTLVRKSNPLLHKYKELINRLNLFLGDDEAPKNFYKTKLIGTFNGITNPSLGELNNQIESIKNMYKFQHKDGTPYEQKHKIENSSKKSIQFGVGNCGEHANLIYSLLLEYKSKMLKHQQVRIENMACSRGDHAFVVVNRRKKSTVADLSTWGPEALIIDAWDGDIMYAQTGQSALNSKTPRYYDYYKYIKTHSPFVETSGFIGEGLSERFHQHAKEKNRPHQFFSWKAKYTGNRRTDKRRESTHIPIDLQDKPVVNNKRKRDGIDDFDLLNKKICISNLQ